MFYNVKMNENIEILSYFGTRLCFAVRLLCFLLCSLVNIKNFEHLIGGSNKMWMDLSKPKPHENMQSHVCHFSLQWKKIQKKTYHSILEKATECNYVCGGKIGEIDYVHLQ